MLDSGAGLLDGLTELTLVLVLFTDAARIDLAHLRLQESRALARVEQRLAVVALVEDAGAPVGGRGMHHLQVEHLAALPGSRR